MLESNWTVSDDVVDFLLCLVVRFRVFEKMVEQKGQGATCGFMSSNLIRQ